MSDESFPPAAVAAVQEKLIALHASLPEDKQAVLESLLTFASAEGGDERAQRLGQENSIIIVSGRVGPLRIGLDPGGPVKLKQPQPQPSGGVTQPG